MNTYFASKNIDIEEREVRHADLVRSVAAECMVLLENKGVLPLSGESVALFGNGARQTVKGGTGSGDVNTRDIVNVEKGLLDAGIEVVSKDWLDRQDMHHKDDEKSYYDWVDDYAEKHNTQPFFVTFDNPYKEAAAIPVTENDCIPADAAVYVISRNSGEGCDRKDEKGDYYFYDEELDNIRTLAANYEKVIVVLNIGGVMELTPLKDMEGVGAVLLMTQLGNLGGHVLADVLYGKSYPSGRTTDTWAKNYNDYPSSKEFSFHGSVHDEDYTDDIYVGYRYFDSFGIEPLYPFGYGLSYTTFSQEINEVCIDGRDVVVDVTVTNTGKEYSGKEVVQVYVSAPQSGLNKPYQTLAAFAKTEELKPGKAQKVQIRFNLSNVASYSEEKAAWILEAGDYVVRVGSSSADTVVAADVVVSQEIIIEQCKNVFAMDKELELICPDSVKIAQKLEDDKKDVLKLSINADSFNTKTVSYSGERVEYTTDKTEVLTTDDIKAGKCTVEELVAQLTVEELAEMCVGTLRADGGNVVGNASALVPGAAGDSSSIVSETRGVKGMIMADGPAGLRLQPHFKTDLEGNLLPGGDTLGGISAPFDEKYNVTNSIDYYQYCTAIPIGWGLGQSWNTDMVEKIGNLIGEEMDQFGVDLWLAPALNIHRNPLCGRNFEYYSEDPFIAGCITAAMDKGVQSHAGRGTTIKHFAANNQEDNRYFVNAHISERAIREIYIKGFEIAVKESQPYSVMTSYNLINGTHTANRYDLIQSVLRDEWGFEGVVMTDWFTSQHVPMLQGKFKPIYGISSSTGCAKAGNDIQMPGCRKNVTDLIDSVNGDVAIDGIKVTKADLQFCAANVIRVAIK